MRYLNLGCGNHYSFGNEWINIDFISTDKLVIGHNLLSGIPFKENEFDLVYHSHVLEHFSKEDGERFMAECFRVLKPGGVIRVVIPDLEVIVREYLKFLEDGIRNPLDEVNRANYDWMLIEMYDQTVRNYSGGNMAKYLFQETMLNESFVMKRIGEEGKKIRQAFLNSRESHNQASAPKSKGLIFWPINLIRQFKTIFHSGKNKTSELGNFRLGGEIHQWMYDRYSLTNLLKSKGGGNIQVRDAFTSYIRGWREFELDGTNNVTRKPDSLFIEALKS
jgi:predicted SAM-dependent methyltransferase